MLKNFLHDETGAELAEYAVAVALLVAIAVIVYNLLGKAINDSNALAYLAVDSKIPSVPSSLSIYESGLNTSARITQHISALSIPSSTTGRLTCSGRPSVYCWEC